MAKKSLTIVLTGATRGLGRALVDILADQGHTLIGCGRSKKLISELNRSFSDEHYFEAVDVCEDQKVAKWAKEALRRYGAPNYLINNAGVINKSAPLWEVSAKEFQKVIDVNIAGTANVIRHFTPAMIKERRGVIINMSSGWGRSTSPDVAPYCASKWAIEGLSSALAEELPSSMASIALNPGIIDTEMLRSCWGEHAASYPEADDWAKGAADYILSLGAKHNGRSLSVN